MEILWKCSLLALLIVGNHGLNNGLGRTPQMGWNSWYNFWCHYTDQMIKSSVDILIDTGLAQLGYQYINLDDCWQISRDDQGNIVEDPNVFPNGILPLISYVHSKGLKFGLYSDAGYKTCAGRPGSLGYETKDALKYAEWQVDYLKYDNCNNDGSKPEVRYPIMRDALNRTGRPIFYSLCEWGVDQPALWASDVGNSWRTTNDIGDTWDSIIDTIDQNNEYADHAAPGGWNDPDMLRLGYQKMSDEEDRSYFSLWSLSKSPLIIGTDIRKMSNTTLSIYSNPEVIAINQDPLGIQGKKLKVFTSPLSSKTNPLRFSVCSRLEMLSSRQGWIYHSTKEQIRSSFNGECLTREEDSPNSFVLRRCSSTNSRQRWTFDPFHQRFSSVTNDQLCSSIGTSRSNAIRLGECRTERRNFCLTVEQDAEIWSGPLANESVGVIFLNRNSSTNETITVEWKDLGWTNNRTATVRDLWARRDIGTFQSSFTSSPLSLHHSQFVKIQPKD